ncbi:hypothetical protein GCM10008110_12050 [Marinobacter persicus]|nr:hypothetical protein GCM10008110_12050 [Marinobacter persicus]
MRVRASARLGVSGGGRKLPANHFYANPGPAPQFPSENKASQIISTTVPRFRKRAGRISVKQADTR